MPSEREQLNQRIMQLEKKIAELVKQFHITPPLPEKQERYASNGVGVGGASGAAIGGFVAVVMAPPVSIPAGVVTLVVGGIAGSTTGINVGREAGRLLASYPPSQEKIANQIREKNKELAGHKITLIRKGTPGEEIDFVLNANLGTATTAIYEGRCFLEEISKELYKALKEQAQKVVNKRREIVFPEGILTEKTWGELLDAWLPLKAEDILLNDAGPSAVDIAAMAFDKAMAEKEDFQSLQEAIRKGWEATESEWIEVKKIQLQTLDFSGMGLTADLLNQLLLASYIKNFDVTHLNLSYNRLGVAGTRRLKELLVDKKIFPKLKKLDLAGNNLQGLETTESDIERWGKDLLTGAALQDIKSIVCSLDLEALDLSDNEQLGGLFKDQRVFKNNIESRTLVFSRGSTEAFLRFLCKVPQEMPSLKYLGLRNVGLKSSRKEAPEEHTVLLKMLARVFKMSPLIECVDLRNNPELGLYGLSILKKGVDRSISLKTLLIDATDEMDEGALASSITATLAAHNAQFEKLGTAQPRLVALLNAQRANKLPSAIIAFLSQRKNKPLLHFHYDTRRDAKDKSTGEINFLLDNILFKRVKDGHSLKEAISEQELIAFIKWVAALVKNSNKATPSTSMLQGTAPHIGVWPEATPSTSTMHKLPNPPLTYPLDRIKKQNLSSPVWAGNNRKAAPSTPMQEARPDVIQKVLNPPLAYQWDGAKNQNTPSTAGDAKNNTLTPMRRGFLLHK